MKTKLPDHKYALRRAIYAGGIFKLPAGDVSLSLVEKVNNLLQDEFKNTALRKIHDSLSFAQLSNRLMPLRLVLADSLEYQSLLRELIKSYGFTPQENTFDPFRLRCVLQDGHLLRGSARAYALHRDTWYGNPQSQINWWMPLHDVAEDDSFAFYPEYFSNALPNDSAQFNFNDWRTTAGWQGTGGGTYPCYPAAADSQFLQLRKGFKAAAGDIVLFSAAHLHGTCQNTTGLTRWSLDFRTVHSGDAAAQRGAPNVDNGSLPLAAAGYVRSPATQIKV
jgi:hypothetical protein